jgi:hypothetical protein
MSGVRQGYNGVAVNYFIGTRQDHYVFKLGYVIAQADEKVKVVKLETLMEILTFGQGNMFALGSLVCAMLIVEKEPVNWATWFSHKLQIELVATQCKVGKATSTLVEPTLTMIEYFY